MGNPEIGKLIISGVYSIDFLLVEKLDDLMIGLVGCDEEVDLLISILFEVSAYLADGVDDLIVEDPIGEIVVIVLILISFFIFHFIFLGLFVELFCSIPPKFIF